MNFSKFFIITILSLLAVLTPVFAAETFELSLENQQGVDLDGYVYVHKCLDKACSQSDSSFTPQKIDSVNSVVSITIPDSNTIERYAAFIYSDEYIPFKGTFDEVGTTNQVINGTVALFKKDICYAPIISHYVVNNVVEYQPIQINVSAEIGAEVASAFRLTNGTPSFVPQEALTIESDSWSANTVVTVKLTDGEGVVHTITDRADIFADQTEQFTFTWIPEVEGETTVEIIATIDDNQCETSESVTRTDSFTVLKDLSSSFYHAFILDANAPAYPVANENFDVTFDTLSYFADNGTFSATPTEIDYVVYAENGNIVTSGNYVVTEIDEQTFQESVFTLNLPAGEYDVRIIAIADDYTYNVPRNNAYVNLDVIVEDARYDLSITAIDALTNNGITNAKVDVNSFISYTGTAGTFVFANMFTGSKNIEVSKDGFIPQTDSIGLTSDLSRTYTLQRTTCNDGIDNDGDGFIDYPADPDCLSINDQENRNDTPEDPTYNFTLLVEDGLDDSPLANADIVFEGQAFTTPANGQITFTNLDVGNYTFSVDKFGWGNLPSMTLEITNNRFYTVNLARASCNDLIDNENDGFIDLADPECITINDFEGLINNSNQSNEYDFTLTVLDASTTNPIGGVYVAFGTENYLTNNNGVISIQDLESGNYSYEASLFGYNTATGTYEITQDTNEVLYLVPLNNPVEQYNFTLTVLDATTTNPIAGAIVEFGGVTVTTNNNGMISFTNLNVGNYSYNVSASNYESTSGVYEVDQNTNEIVYLLPINIQPNYDLLAVPIVTTYNDSSNVIICQDNFAIGYNNTAEIPVTVLLNGVQLTGIQSLTFGNPVRECINFGTLQNGTYTVIQTIDPFNQFLDDDRSNNILQYTFVVGPSGNGGTDPTEEEDISEIPRIGITAFDFFAIDYSKASELDQIQIGLTNDGDFRMKDVVITLSIPELAVWDRVRIDELYVGETEYDYLRLGVYDSYEPGFYDLRVSVMTSSGYSRARWFEVYLE